MTDHDHLERLLLAALPPTTDLVPSRDLWPSVLDRGHTRVQWSWPDLGIAALVATVLWIAPDWLWLLVYHL